MAGLLDFYSDPQQMGLLGLSAGLLSAGGPQRFPVSTGQALGGGLLQGGQLAQQTQGQNLQRQLLQAQTQHLGNVDQLTQAQVSAALRQQVIQEDMLRRLGYLPAAQGAVAPPQNISNTPSVIAANPQANISYGVPISGSATPGVAPQSGLGIPEGLRTPVAMDIAFNQGKGVGGMMATFNKPISGRAGAPLWGVGPDGKPAIVGFSPKLDEGMTLGPEGKIQLAPGYAESKTEIGGIPNPSAPMVKIPVSNQRELSLTQPEFIRYTQSGGTMLPGRFSSLSAELPGVKFGDAAGPASLPAGVPEKDRAAYEAVRSGGVSAAYGTAPQVSQNAGVVGATQSQTEQVQQARQTAAGKAVDEQFAKDYVAFTTGGAQDAAKQLAQLKDVSGALIKPGAKLTGPVIGTTPDMILKVSNPNAIAMRERVEEVVQRSLRAILGAQFTEKEGERLIARAYNPNLSEKENAIRVERLTTQLEQAFNAKQDAARYFERNGTLQGWQGKLPSISDFDPSKPAGASGGWSIRPAGG